MKLVKTRFIFALTALAIQLQPFAHAYEVAFESEKSVPVVYLNVALKAGAATDPQGKSGITHFLAEMLLRGTRARTKQQLDLALDQMGARLDVETRAESMILRGAVLSTQLEPFLSLLSEVLTQPSFPEGEIQKLKKETISSLLEELGNDASLGNRKFYQFLFRGHPYGNPILGKSKDVESIRRADLLKHYDSVVKSSLLLVIGSGDASEESIDSWTKKLSQALPPETQSTALKAVAAPQNPQGRRLILVDKPERTQTQINGGQVGIRMTDPLFFPLYLGNFAFGGGSFSARMMVEIRVKRGWSYGANSYFRHGLQPRSWQFHLFPKEKDTPAALEYSLKMLEDLKSKGLTPEEYQFAQQSLVNSSGFMFDTPKKRVENTLLEKTLQLPMGFMKSYGVELQKVKLEQVNAALNQYILPEKQTIVVVGTAKNLKEPLAKAAGMKAEQVEVVPYTQD